MKYVWYWIVDYFYALKTFVHTQVYRAPHPNFKNESSTKAPVIVIPGLMQRWNVFRHIIFALLKDGHPVYTVKGLKRNVISVERAARLVRAVIDDNNLQNVILLAHSKGGLAGKYILAFLNSDRRVKKLIALSAPFQGSTLAVKIPIDVHKEMNPGAEILNLLNNHPEVDSAITCVYPKWDNLVKPLQSATLKGAKNIQIDVFGHQKLVFHPQTVQTVLAEAEI